MKAYLDNNIVSATAGNDTPTESDAFDRLLAGGDARKIELITSEITLDEIKRYSGHAWHVLSPPNRVRRTAVALAEAG